MNLTIKGSQTISPTAHYTGYVWARNGLGTPALATREGRLLSVGVQGVFLPSRILGGPTIDDFLLARHRVMDLLLTEEIESGRITQVLELAAGMSPRGHSYATTYGDAITYIEVDLPGMVARKRAALAELGTLGPHHRVETADVFKLDGLDELAGELDPARGLVVITEGLVNYFPTPAVEGLWATIAHTTSLFDRGLYLSDLHVESGNRGAFERVFMASLSAFVRGKVHLHFRDVPTAEAALREAGFANARLHAPKEYADRLPGMTAPGAHRVRVVEARTGAGE